VRPDTAAAANAGDDDDDDDDDGCRMYVERVNDSTLMLHIDGVRRSDEGQYNCESDFDGQLATQHSQLTIYGQSPAVIGVDSIYD